MVIKVDPLRHFTSILFEKILQIFPKQKEAEFDVDGRPYHPFYYCRKPAFVQTMYDIVEKIEDLTFKADRAKRLKVEAEDEKLINTPVYLSTTRWMTKEELSALFEDSVNDRQVDELITALERLLENDWSYECEELIFKFRTSVAKIRATEKVCEISKNDQGRAYTEYIGNYWPKLTSSLISARNWFS